ncbi:MAG: hypothetical protein WBQ94_10315, partial [Terracidiphilus sp.]
GALLNGHLDSGNEEAPGLDEVAGESSALYEQVGSADAAPTAAQLKAAEHANEELTEILNRWKHSKETAIPALNRQLDAAHLPLLNLEQKPRTVPESGDED